MQVHIPPPLPLKTLRLRLGKEIKPYPWELGNPMLWGSTGFHILSLESPECMLLLHRAAYPTLCARLAQFDLLHLIRKEQELQPVRSQVSHFL